MKSYFFKKNVAINPGNPLLYKKLYDVIAAQKKYNEADVLRKLSPTYTLKNIAFQKHYLHSNLTNA